MTDLLTRLKNWETIYPCDLDKPEGHLYEEAHHALYETIKRLRRIDSWVEENFYIQPEVFDGIKEILKEYEE